MKWRLWWAAVRVWEMMCWSQTEEVNAMEASHPGVGWRAHSLMEARRRGRFKRHSLETQQALMRPPGHKGGRRE